MENTPDAEVSDKELIDSIVAQVANDSPVPSSVPSLPASALEIPVLPRKAAPRSAPAPVAAPSDWKDYFSIQLLKYVLLATVLIFVLHQTTVLDAIKSVLPESLPLHAHLPSLLVALLAGSTIVLVQHSQLL